MKYRVGDVVKIHEILEHDYGYAGQEGIICNIYQYKNEKSCDSLSDYSVLAYDTRSRRFWCCGFTESELTPKGYAFTDFVNEYNHWMRSQYNKDTGILVENSNKQKNTIIKPLDTAIDRIDCSILMDKINEIVNYINR